MTMAKIEPGKLGENDEGFFSEFLLCVTRIQYLYVVVVLVKSGHYS